MIVAIISVSIVSKYPAVLLSAKKSAKTEMGHHQPVKPSYFKAMLYLLDHMDRKDLESSEKDLESHFWAQICPGKLWT